MFRSSCLATLICSVPLAAVAQSPNYCRNSFKQNEPIELRFMGLEYQILAFALAEKYCGAKPKSLKSRFLGYLEKNGCGPGTEIYSQVGAAIARMEGSSLKIIDMGAEENVAMSRQQVEEWASNTVAEFGGCEALTKAHDVEN
ncbi:hypothetical protein [Rhizobium leguminosarum]|uniref:Uncharacterized protein n=1 Tax=Rhizobium leguminosarum TaxID=384 RepID=A0A2K9Z401_RHILE|nr:hypothetical protein [Rhizobium leguminosarum]AUW42831.1 conserved exported protein of unknown function [Rhizobium leguminosarum]